MVLKQHAKGFFQTTPKDIAAEEAAMLVGMLKSPTIYNPRKHHERALDRRNTVLYQLYANEYLSEAEKDSLEAIPLSLKYNRLTHKDGLAPHFREYLRLHLDSWLKNTPKADGSYYNLYTDGLVIHTTIHSKLQEYAQQAVKQHLASLQKRLNIDLERNKVFVKNETQLLSLVKQSERYKMEVNKGLSESEVLSLFEKKGPIELVTPNGVMDTVMSLRDSILYTVSQLQAGMLVQETGSGAIKVWVGGRAMKMNEFDHVLSKRQVGSVFKPIVYAQALRGGKGVCDYVSNQKVTYTSYNNWSPKILIIIMKVNIL